MPFYTVSVKLRNIEAPDRDCALDSFAQSMRDLGADEKGYEGIAVVEKQDRKRKES
jgi:hypothetical protein